ncbi:MAG: hypothetical protein AB1758_17710 [Candidatus Eremiobacterota bacterium]
MNIQCRLAVDHNRNQAIEPDEVVRGLSELAPRDHDGDSTLAGRELSDIYFEYGQDRWLEAGVVHREEADSCTMLVELRQIALKSGTLDLNIRILPG